MPLIPVSIGEVIDKLTILKIKLQKISDPVKVQSVRQQYSQILECLKDFNLNLGIDLEIELDLDEDFLSLKDINSKLWDQENLIRLLVRIEDFGDSFVEVSKNIRFWNDERAVIKQKIDQRFGSEFWDVKDHSGN